MCGTMLRRHRGLDDLRIAERLLEPADSRLHQALRVLGRVVLGVLPDVPVLARHLEALRDPVPSVGDELVELGLQAGVRLERQRRGRLLPGLAFGTRFSVLRGVRAWRESTEGLAGSPASQPEQTVRPRPGRILGRRVERRGTAGDGTAGGQGGADHGRGERDGSGRRPALRVRRCQGRPHRRDRRCRRAGRRGIRADGGEATYVHADVSREPDAEAMVDGRSRRTGVSRSCTTTRA